MNTSQLINLINLALIETDNFVKESEFYVGTEEIIINTKKVLNLLKEQILHNDGEINDRVLRAMHDLGVASFKYFENWPLEDALNNVTDVLYNEIPCYKNLAPLLEDFGKGNPI